MKDDSPRPENDFEIGIVMLGCHNPFTHSFNDVVKHWLILGDKELEESLAAGNRKHVIRLLAQRCETLNEAIISRGILRKSKEHKAELVNQLVVTTAVLERCGGIVVKSGKASPPVSRWKIWMAWLNGILPYRP